MKRGQEWSKITLLVLGLAFLGCAGSDDMYPPVRPPLQTARISTYGWPRFLGLIREIFVRLRPEATIRDVVDLSPFGALRPGMTDQEARRAAGPPAETYTDAFGETWLEYRTAGGWAQVGCECAGGEYGPPTTCRWTLYGYYEKKLGERALHSELRRLVELARQAPVTVESTTLDISSADGEALYFPLDPSGRAHWSDTRRLIVRPGCKAARKGWERGIPPPS